MKTAISCFLLLVWVSPALAAPRLLVRARTVIRDVEKLQRPDGSTVVRGRLLDKDFLHGIPLRRIEATVLTSELQRHRVATRTDRLGNFNIRLPRDRGIYQVSFRFAGDQIYARETTPRVEIDVTKMSLDLDLAVASSLDAANPTQSITATARAARNPVSVPLTLSTAGGQVLARFSTSRMSGKATVSFSTSKLGRPGPKILIASFAGNSEINRISMRYETILETPVFLSLEADADEVPADEEVLLSGTARDPTGPLVDAAITIKAMGAPAASAVTDARGQFSLSLATNRFPAGELDFTAHYSPNVIWRRAASSSPVEITILTPRPIPLRLYALPAVLTVMLLVALVMVRFRDDLARLFRRRDPGRKAPVTPTQEPVKSGVRLSRRTFRSLITQSTTISGEVWDATDTTLVTGAEVEIRDAAGAMLERSRTDGLGRFASGDLAAGTHSVTIRKDGFVSETFRCQIPHRGTLNGLKVDLVQVRVRVLEIYKDASIPLLPREEYWGHWTPRELVSHLSRQAGRRHRVLELLTSLLEEAYWSRAPARESALQRARELAASVVKGRTARD